MTTKEKAQLAGCIKRGPARDIVLEPPHGRGVTCGAISERVAVTGSSDHGLRVYHGQTGKYSRELFSKSFGHREWVSSVQVSELTGKIVSGGMDNAICLWDASGVRCDYLQGHEGSISKLVLDSTDTLLSASYDCTIRAWGLKSIGSGPKGLKKDSCADILVGPHKDPIMDFVWKNSLVVSGDRKGLLAFWDLNKAQAIKTFPGHLGAVSTISLLETNDTRLIASGGLKDGKVCLFDLRQEAPIFSKQLHSGAVNCVFASGNQLVSGSADQSLSFLDLRDTEQTQRLKIGQSVLGGRGISDAGLFGLVDGSLVGVDLSLRKTLFAFGASKSGGLRVIEVCESTGMVLVAGEDPSGLLLSFQ